MAFLFTHASMCLLACLFASLFATNCVPPVYEVKAKGSQRGAGFGL